MSVNSFIWCLQMRERAAVRSARFPAGAQEGRSSKGRCAGRGSCHLQGSCRLRSLLLHKGELYVCKSLWKAQAGQICRSPKALRATIAGHACSASIACRLHNASRKKKIFTPLSDITFLLFRGENMLAQPPLENAMLPKRGEAWAAGDRDKQFMQNGHVFFSESVSVSTSVSSFL